MGSFRSPLSVFDHTCIPKSFQVLSPDSATSRNQSFRSVRTSSFPFGDSSRPLRGSNPEIEIKKDTTTIILGRACDEVNPKLFKAVFGVTPKNYLEEAGDAFDGLKPVSWHRYCEGWIGSRSRSHGEPCSNCGMPTAIEAHEITQLLLSHGGMHVNLPAEVIPYAGAFTRYGEFQTDPPITMVQGEPNMCHVNVCKLHRSGDMDGQMMTGFALARDGTWYLHSWWRRSDGTILETTPEPFQEYFGVALSDAGADAYCNIRVGPAQPLKAGKAKRGKNKPKPK